ncbi:MAG: cereblon family protein [Desulforhopalus sp.]
MEKIHSRSYCFRGDRQGEGDLPLSDEKTKTRSGPIEAIFCRACGMTVTSRDQKISVQGSHSHTFFNPAGIVFELGCFRQAPGCFVAGEPSSEFTWFAGHLWSFALCKSCRSHLGWFFDSGSASFYGLILTNLME